MMISSCIEQIFNPKISSVLKMSISLIFLSDEWIFITNVKTNENTLAPHKQLWLVPWQHGDVRIITFAGCVWWFVP